MRISIVVGAHGPIGCSPAPKTTLSSVLADLGYEVSEVASATEGTSSAHGNPFLIDGLVRHNRTYYITLSEGSVEPDSDNEEEEEAVEPTPQPTIESPQGSGQPLNEADLVEMALLSRADLLTLQAHLEPINAVIRKGDWKSQIAGLVGETLANAVCGQICIRIGRALGYSPTYIRGYADRFGSIVAALQAQDGSIMESNKLKLKALFGL